jgi:glyoxylase-like metal-dependent hydrolase (beta-lactamase superfamily II)
LDKENLINPGSDGLPFDLDIRGVQPDILLKDGDIFHLEEFYFQVIHTPGHSYGSSCFYFPDEVLLISGDTLFKGTYGNISFPTSEPNKIKSSLEKLAKLPKETTVWPGHGDPTTIGVENWLQNLNQIIED